MRSPYLRPEDAELEGSPDTSIVPTQDAYARCHFCSSRLVFSHDLDLPYLEVVETGRCPGCGVAHSPKRHRLQ